MRIFASLLITAGAVAMTAPAMAAPAPAWSVNKAQSQLGFSGTVSGKAFSGKFTRFDARIVFDPKNLSGSSVTAVIDTASAVTGDQTRDEALPTPDWFNVKVMPRATFSSTNFKDLGGGHYLATGMLTIRGIARPTALPFQLTIAGKMAKMRGSLAIDRRWFGVGQGQFATPEMVAAKVQIDVSITAVQAH